ncbi:MAG: site-specific integrase [Rikenellaceae bacterium]
MRKLSRETFKVSFIIKRTRLLKDGTASIFGRIVANGETSEFALHRTIKPAMWCSTKEGSRGRDAVAYALNNYIGVVRTKIYDIHCEMVRCDDIITAAAIKNKYIHRDEIARNTTICTLYSQHNARCAKLIGVDYAKGTVDKFESTLRVFRIFLHDRYNKEDLKLRELTIDVVREYDLYLKTVRHCQQNSAKKHLQNLKKITSEAISSGLMHHNPFLGVTIRDKEVEQVALTMEEIAKIRDKEFDIERISRVRDVFLFSVYTGLSFADLKEMTAEHIIKDNNGNEWIRKHRRKSNSVFSVPLLRCAKDILVKYSNNYECRTTGKLLLVPSNQRMNAYLKEIADICGVKKRLTTHVARHSCGSTILLANGVRMENIAKILGHKDIRMTQHYAQVSDKSILADMAAVELQIDSLVGASRL